MKLKNILMCMAAVSVLFSCSDNEPYLDKPENLEPTTMSICIDADGVIVSAKSDATISNMYVLVFKADGSYANIVDATTDSNDENGAENRDIKVEGGAHQVLVLANVPSTIDLTGKSLSAVQQETTSLDQEADGNLTMSSEVMQVTFVLNKKNKIGYSNINSATEADAYPALKGDPVKLYRSVARINLSEISLAKKAADETQYGVPVSFTLKEIFVANAKGYSQLASTENTAVSTKDNKYLSIETKTALENKALWWYGGWKNFTTGDKLKDASLTGDITTLSEGLKCDLTEAPNEVVTCKIEDATEAALVVTQEVNKSFYVYENEESPAGYPVGFQTLLVLKGDYTYQRTEPIDENDLEVSEGVWTREGRYYAVPINPTVQNATLANKLHRNHKGVVRNTKYELKVTLNGPGSDYPYQPDAHLYFNAQVEVADWSGVNIEGETN